MRSNLKGSLPNQVVQSYKNDLGNITHLYARDLIKQIGSLRLKYISGVFPDEKEWKLLNRFASSILKLEPAGEVCKDIEKFLLKIKDASSQNEEGYAKELKKVAEKLASKLQAENATAISAEIDFTNHIKNENILRPMFTKLRGTFQDSFVTIATRATLLVGIFVLFFVVAFTVATMGVEPQFAIFALGIPVACCVLIFIVAFYQAKNDKRVRLKLAEKKLTTLREQDVDLLTRGVISQYILLAIIEK